jgi:hypothetical protein
MAAKRHIWLILIGIVGMSLASSCGGDSDGFSGTVVAPAETKPAAIPASARSEARGGQPAPADAAPDKAQPAPPSPQPLAPTPPPDNTAAPLPTTPASQPAIPTLLPATSTSLPPLAAEPTVNPTTYLDVPQQVGAVGDIWTLSDIRVGIHPQRYRIVWEMAERRNTAPLTEIMEVDNTKTPFPRHSSLLDPSWGKARIDVIISDCYAYDVPLSDILPIETPGDSPVIKVGLQPTFDDAKLGFSIGLAEPAAYEIYTLTDPVRIVIDVITQP